MLNCAILVGRICHNLELCKTPAGVSVTRFTVAVDRGFVKAGEERKTDFITVVCWRQTAELVCRYFSKGQMIAVQGSIQTGTYKKDGIKYKTFEIVADNVSFCGEKNGCGNSSEFVSGEAETESFDINDDELPF